MSVYLSDGIKFETFRGNKYKFCSKTNIVVKQNEDAEYDDNNRRDLWNDFYSKLYKDYESDWYNLDSAEKVEELLCRTGFRQLVIEVTSSCNLRCSYCCFSENYENFRSHGYENMTWDIAKKSIDLYFEYYKKAKTFNPNLRPVIGFYGGEPLLNFKLIKQSVLYIKTLFTESDNLYLNLTTNGILLNEDIIQFFNNEGVTVVVSIDGDKLSHDRNRVFENGKGTFDIVMNNVSKMYEITKERVYVNTIYDIKTNLENVFNFFDKHQHLCNIGISPVNPHGTDYYKKFSENDMENHLELEKRLLNEFIEIVTDEDFLNKQAQYPFMVHFFGRSSSSPLMKSILQPDRGVIRYTGTCTPGTKIFVDTRGSFHMCEKVTRDWSIGDVHSGVDFKKILEIIDYYNLTTSKCKNCAIKNVCTNCFATIEDHGKLNIDKNSCKRNIDNYKKSLELTYSILEKNSYWFEFYLDEYYKNLRKIGGIKGC